MTHKEQIGDCTLYLGDCLEILPTLSKVDAVVTDPPYGIKQDKGFRGSVGVSGVGQPIARRQYTGEWDRQRPPKAIFDMFLKITDQAIVFGGNYFTDYLPVGKQWLVWDKINTMPSFGDCELAWTNLKRNSVKLLRYESNGLMGRREDRVHPTQKPVDVMRWCVNHLSPDSQAILDPFMGSGTTGVVCAKLGRKFIGIEIDASYFDIACKRIEDAYRQPDLFIPSSAKAKQKGFL